MHELFKPVRFKDVFVQNRVLVPQLPALELLLDDEELLLGAVTVTLPH